MVAATPRHVRGRLRQRSGPEPIGCTAESNQPYVLPLGADDTGSQIAGPDTGRSRPPALRALRPPRPLALGQAHGKGKGDLNLWCVPAAVANESADTMS